MRGLKLLLGALLCVGLGAGLAHVLHQRGDLATVAEVPAIAARAVERPSTLPAVAPAAPAEEDEAEDSEAAEASTLPDPAHPPDDLQRSEISAGMEHIRQRVQACYDLYNQPGLATVKIAIASTGRVSSARVAGPFEGTETAECVEAAARGAQFRAFKRPQTLLTYAFALKTDGAE